MTVQSAVLCCLWPVCAPFPALHSKPFLPPEPVQLLVVHVYPFALQHQTEPAIAKAPPVCRDLAHHALSDLLICLLLLAPHRLRIRPRSGCRPGPARPHGDPARSELRPGVQPDPSAVSQQVLQDGIIEHLVGQKALQPGVLLLKHLEPTGLGNAHAAIFGLPFAERAGADPMPAANLCRRAAPFLLRQTALNDWGSVMKDVCRSLRKRLANEAVGLAS